VQHHPGGSHLVSSASGFVVAGAGYFIYHKMKDAYYFPHDSNAKDDPKMVMLIEQLGLEGYGIFWVLIETLREQPDYKYPLSLLPAIARRYNTTSEKVKTVVGNYALFSIVDDDFFLSESLIKRMLPLEERRAKNRIAGLKSAEKRQRMLNECSTNVQHALNECSTSKVKKSKVNKSKVKKNKLNESKEKTDISFSEKIEKLKEHYRQQWYYAKEKYREEKEKEDQDTEKIYLLKKINTFLITIPKFIEDNELEFVSTMNGQFKVDGLLKNNNLLDVEAVNSLLISIERSDTVKSRKNPNLNLTVLDWMRRGY
jgi:hypothetical protein